MYVKFQFILTTLTRKFLDMKYVETFILQCSYKKCSIISYKMIDHAINYQKE